MRALRIHETSGPDALTLDEDAPLPQRGDGMVLVDVHATGVSFPDLLLTRGEYQMKPDPPFTPGVEVAGTVREADPDSGLQVGQRVAAACMLAGWAEVAACPAPLVFPIPDDLTFEEAAGLVMNHHTAWFALQRRGALREGETVLIHGAAGGVGHAGIQVAKGLGARVLAVCSTDEKADFARRAGADETIDSTGEWRKAAKALTDGRGVDVVLDPVGGDRFTDSIRSLAPEGRLLVVGFAQGSIPEVRVNRLLLNNVSLVGAAWGAFLATDPSYAAETARELDRLLADGVVRPLVGSSRPLAEGAAALHELDSRGSLGKSVLVVRED